VNVIGTETHAVRPGSQWISVREAAAILDLDPSRVRKLIRQKRLKATWYPHPVTPDKPEGGFYRINRKDLEEFATIPRPPGNPGSRRA
jgi:Helix-turn-helix domain